MSTIKKKSVKSEGDSTPEKKEKTIIYIGPTIRQISLLQHRLFRNGLSAECQKLLDIVPGAKHLFVATADLSTAQKNLLDKTSVESVMYARVVSAMKEIK
ncbi:hypothetical protein [Citrobacter amalonaticus]|uniref:hypothetical protein n=1 Tax=Citrobacter amalonaticus TaxID=35703 RepID=UPI000A372437|nr:hypothetical protein [Citrobacter amalonaticus]OUE50263.1 hypothetical protein AZ012_004656 [Citrobacter amalonaticus]